MTYVTMMMMMMMMMMSYRAGQVEREKSLKKNPSRGNKKYVNIEECGKVVRNVGWQVGDVIGRARGGVAHVVQRVDRQRQCCDQNNRAC